MQLKQAQGFPTFYKQLSSRGSMVRLLCSRSHRTWDFRPVGRHSVFTCDRLLSIPLPLPAAPAPLWSAAETSVLVTPKAIPIVGAGIRTSLRTLVSGTKKKRECSRSSRRGPRGMSSFFQLSDVASVECMQACRSM